MKQISKLTIHFYMTAYRIVLRGHLYGKNGHKPLLTIVDRYSVHRGTQRGNELRWIIVMTKTVVAAVVMLLMNWLLKCGTV